MLQEENSTAFEDKIGIEDKTGIQNNKDSLSLLNGSNVTIIICVALSMMFMRTGFLSLFFLAPLGYAILVTGSTGFTFLAALAANIIVSVIISIFGSNDSILWMDIINFSMIIMIFAWIIGGKIIRVAYRIVLGAAVGALAFLILIISNKNLTEYMLVIAEFLSSIFISAIDNELATQAVTAERLLDMIISISWRGGALVSMALILVINRQMSFAVYKLIKKHDNINRLSLTGFFVPINIIWIKVGALAAVIVSGMLKIDVLEIISWNVLVVCAMLFIAQGIGIVLFLLAKRSNIFRITASILFAVTMLSPINSIVLVALLLLGVIEIWLPIRSRK